MGVLGFAPFLQRQFPEVIKELPQRLRSLSGKTIAIDGTLITQRLHFAPVPCQNRHVLGWYRLVRELKECGVGVICVFDGEERSHAKQRETERRRKIQRVQVARGAMEIERLRRLRRITALLRQYRGLTEAVKARATAALQSIMVKPPERQEIDEPAERQEIDEPPERQEVDEPLEDIAMNSDFDTAHFTGEQLDPLIHQKDSRNVNEISPDGQTLQSRAAQEAADETETCQGIVSRLDETSKVLRSGSGLRTLKDVLPSYFVNETPDNHISSVKESHTQPPDFTVVSLPDKTRSLDAVADAPDDDRRRPPRQKYGQADGLRNDATSTIEGSQSVPDRGLVPPDAPPLGEKNGLDESVLKSPDKGLVTIPPTPVSLESVPSSNLDFEGSLEGREDFEVASRENNSLLTSDLDITLHGPEIADVELSPEDLSQGLLSLYQEYRESVPSFLSTPILDPPGEVSTTSEEASVQDQYMMSRNQVQLTLDEGNFWEEFVSSPSLASEGMESSLTQEKLELLARKSTVISRSYEKRNNPPTPKTYEECKLILRAMGVPCVDAVGPFEAEALAASLVRNGLADYVASEDTDVLVYEAPLLRNLTNRQNPLTLLSGAEVREVLQLDRASYVDFALLLGTDFSERIKYLGPHRAIKLIRTHGRIEHVIANEPKFIPRVSHDTYLKQVEVARLVFETLPPVPDLATLRQTESDDEAVVAILEKFGVYRAASVDWDFGSALDGNYFGDDPSIA